MPKRKGQSAEVIVQAEVPAVEGVEQPQVPTRLDLLEGFADLVGERMGYFMARRLKQKEMGEKCEKELKAVRDMNNSIHDHIVELIEEEKPEVRDAIHKEQKELKSLHKTAAEATKPFRDKISELAKAVKYCDNVFIPDSLKELGKAVSPRFSLSEHVAKALESAAKKKKKEE